MEQAVGFELVEGVDHFANAPQKIKVPLSVCRKVGIRIRQRPFVVLEVALLDLAERLLVRPNLRGAGTRVKSLAMHSPRRAHLKPARARRQRGQTGNRVSTARAQVQSRQ